MFVQWETCNKPTSLPIALNLAEGALRSCGLPILNPACDGDYQVIGGNSQVIVSVVCVSQPADVWMTINACSADQATAQMACNQIRALILNNV